MNNTATKNIFGLILAAGSASRFGSTKQLETVDGRPLVRRAVRLCNEAFGDRTLLVVGHDWQRVFHASGLSTGYLACNDSYATGIGSSIAAGIRALRHVADAVVVMMADQPLITVEHLRTLARTWTGADSEIVTTAFAATTGPPVLFPRACFAELVRLAGDSGAKPVLQDPRFTVRSVIFEAAAIDVDTPADLRRASSSARN